MIIKDIGSRGMLVNRKVKAPVQKIVALAQGLDTWLSLHSKEEQEHLILHN